MEQKIVTATKVFEDTGEGDNGPWTRWAYLADGERYVTYKPELRISVNTPTEILYEEKNGKKFIRAVLSAGNQQATQESQNGSEAAVQGHKNYVHSSGRDFQAEAEGKTRCALVSQLLPAMFTALPEDEQTMAAADEILKWAFNYVFQIDPVA